METNMLNEGPLSNSAEMNTPYNKQILNPPCSPQEMNDLIAYRIVYPEIFYKLQPYVMICCDQMDAAGTAMPTQEIIEQMSNGIYDDICRMYPDIAEYASSCEKKTSADPDVLDVVNGFRTGYRRRGLLRDVIDILLLSEFFRRRRRVY